MPTLNDEILKLYQGYGRHQFENHCRYLLNSTLNAWAEKILLTNTYPLVPKDEEKPLMIFFEDRSTEQLRFTILNSLIMCKLKVRGIVYTVPSAVKILQEFLSDLSDWIEVLSIKDSDIKTFAGIHYSNLLKRKSFWSNIPARKVLIIHTDALLIEPLDFSLFNYDYIGAPWSPAKILSIPIYRYSKDLMSESGAAWFTYQFNLHPKMMEGELPFGNGGLTIRDTKKMIEICSNNDSLEEEPEDIYFGRLVRSSNSKIPSTTEARRFACETDYFDSTGSHASHLYLSPEDQARIYFRHISHLTGMIMASYKYKKSS